MTTMRPSYDEFSDMPSGLRQFLLSDDVARIDDQLQQDFALTNEQKNFMEDTFLEAAFNDSTLPESVADLKAAFVPKAMPDIKWTDFLTRFLKSYAWPLRELFGDELTQILAENQIKTAGWPSYRVILKPLTYSGAASEVAAIVGFSLMAPQLRERLRDLLVSKMKGVRIDSQVREVLVRQEDFGGLGLDAATADKTIQAVNQLLSTAQILSEEQYANWLAEENRKKVEAMAAATLPPSEDDAEIAAIKQKMPAAPVSVLDQSVHEVFDGLTGKPQDEYLSRRLEYIISSRLRDVRSSLELKQLLMRDTKVGGLGLSREASDAMATQIEEGYVKFHEPIMKEERQKLDQQMEEQKTKIAERKTREAAEHAAWYQEKVAARKQGEVQRTKLAEQMRETLTHPMDVKEQKTETARFGEMVPAATVAAPAVPAAQAAVRPEVKISKATADLQQATATPRPRLDDIKYAGPRLTGPIQELKSLTLAEFRRIAKDPELAAQKIIQRIEILGQESFEKRVEGIKAWQGCPLQRDYFKLVAESFRTGNPVAQVAETQRLAGQDVPTPAEIAAIISLNSKLHF